MRLCVSVLFRPKARNILAITAINTMCFFFFFSILLQKCSLREKPNKITEDCCFSLLAFKAAIKIKGDNDRGLKAEPPRSLEGLNGVF